MQFRITCPIKIDKGINNSIVRNNKRIFFRLLSYMEHNFYDNSIIVVAPDHGEAFYEKLGISFFLERIFYSSCIAGQTILFILRLITNNSFPLSFLPSHKFYAFS